MARRLLVDTGILIGIERGTTAMLDAILPDDDLVVAAITVAELHTGVELASEKHRSARAAFVAEVVVNLPVEPYDLAVAEAHGRLLAHVSRAGEKRGAHDLIVAATAVATKRTILTSDRAARFDELPGVDVVLVL